jgi:hypothetical protein
MRVEEDVDAWCCHMRAGNFSAAWAICDRVLAERQGIACWHLPRHQQWVWDGAAVDGRDVLVRCYHGLGDTIQFARYFPLVRRRARSLTVWAQSRLIPLLETMELPGSRLADPGPRLLALHDGDPAIACGVDIESMELPHVFRTSVDTIPSSVPYFTVTPLRLRSSHRQKVGLVWAAGEWNEDRSVPFHQLKPLIEIDVDWYVLQGGTALDDRPAGFGTVIGTNDIMEAAAAMRALDLVITIDSMPAHLAGALGTRTWTLLPEPVDWRWMNGRTDTPWYPTMRLFRQEQPGNWRSVIEQVAAELRQMTTIPATQLRN